MNNFFNLIKKWLLLGLLATLLLSFFYFGFDQYLTFHTLKKYQTITQEWTLAHYTLAIGLYILIYIVLIACAIPCSTLFTLLGGFLFGSIAIIYAIFSLTLGGIVLFFAVRTAIGIRIATKSSGWIKNLEKGFQQNAFHYLLILRLMPVFPCWVSNIAAGALNVPLKTFVFATILGVLPATFIYVMIGRGLDTLFLGDQLPNINALLTPVIFFPIMGLVILSILPLFYKAMRKL